MPHYARTGILASPPKDAPLAVTQTSDPNAPVLVEIAIDAAMQATSAEQRASDASATERSESIDDARTHDRTDEEEPLQPDWQALPTRAHTVFRYVALLSTSAPAAIVSLVLYNRFGAHMTTWIAIGGVFAAAIAIGLWLAYRRYRYTFWKLDRDGFAVKRGRIWQWETRVPTTRVQHMDLKRGPLERAHGLASVILHTAGTRLSAVSVSGIDHHDAERLREYLTRQIDRQDGDDSEHV
jgi:uncharacterized protein